jgi:excisionase family DNA binding protein
MATVRPEITGRKGSSRGLHGRSERLTYTIPEAGRLLGLSRNAAYGAAKRGDIPILQIGRRRLVPKILFHRMLGINATAITAEVATNLP